MPASQTTPLCPVRNRQPTSNPGMVAPSPDSRRRIIVEETSPVVINSKSSRKRSRLELNDDNVDEPDVEIQRSNHASKSKRKQPKSPKDSEVCISLDSSGQSSTILSIVNMFSLFIGGNKECYQENIAS